MHYLVRTQETINAIKQIIKNEKKKIEEKKTYITMDMDIIHVLYLTICI